MLPLPTLPRYSADNVRGIVPALLAPRGVRPAEWMPAAVAGAKQVVLLVLDGLGWEQLQARRALAPNLAAMAGGAITTVAPSTTSTALTSITTGLTPGEHGIVGYRMEMAGEVLNVLRWSTGHGDSRRQIDPTTTQPFSPFMGDRVTVVSKAELERSAFTEAHLRGAEQAGWRSPSSIAVVVGNLLRRGDRMVYAYYDGIDKIAHERGFGPFYDAELQLADAVVGAVHAALPPGAVLLVTADHGQVEVGDRLVTPHADVMRLCRHQSGEGRFRWLHARPGGQADLLAAATEHHGKDAWVHARDEIIGAGWFGPTVSPPIAARYGDVALVPHEPISFHDPLDSGPYPLVCRHGSLTSAEMLVPLLAAAADS
ncbi:MAG TPA: alkaline phosphatase family protein [Ilumatobacteraceae bacterium]|nr:alkaline phosphatase family protein [Ilumatobacteraceae bacterium]